MRVLIDRRETPPPHARTAVPAGAVSSRARRRAAFRVSVPFLAPRSSQTRPFEKEEPMKYMLLIHHGDTSLPGSDEWERLSDDEKKAVYDDYRAINATPGVTPGVWLESPEAATTVRVQDGKTLTTDGPFVAVKEALGGYLFFEADNLDAAMELAARIPAARLGGAVEVRPVKEQ
jgi:hypothetical protein